MKKIFVAGHRGMVGSAICRQLQKKSDAEIITRTRAELDLCDQSAVNEFMTIERPDEVILAAAKVGGIYANNITNWVPIFRAIGAISNISFNIILINRYGVIGSAWATVLSFFVMSVAVFIKLKKSFKVKYNWLGVLFPILSMLILLFDIKNMLLRFMLPIIYILIWYLVIVNDDEKKAIRGLFSW